MVREVASGSSTTPAGTLAVVPGSSLPAALQPSADKVSKQLKDRTDSVVKLLLAGASKVDDSTTLSDTRSFFEDIVAAATKLDKHYAALVRAAGGLPSQIAPTAIAVAGAHGGGRASVTEALDMVVLPPADLAAIQLVGKAEQLQMRRARAAMLLVVSNATLRSIDVAFAAVLDKHVTGSLSAALSDVRSFLHAVAIILSLKGSTAGGRAVAAVDVFTQVAPMAVVASDSFERLATAAITRAEERVKGSA